MFLLSNFSKYYIYNHSDKTGAGDLMLNIQSLIKLPIPIISEEINDYFVKLNSQIISNSHNLANIEIFVNALIYKLFNFNKEEIDLIDIEFTDCLTSLKINYKQYENMSIKEIAQYCSEFDYRKESDYYNS